MKIKTITNSSFFIILLSCTIFYLFKNNNGLQMYYTLKKEFTQEKERVEKLEQEINTLEQNIKNWKTDPLKKEQIARQDLSMSYTNELVYIIPEN